MKTQLNLRLLFAGLLLWMPQALWGAPPTLASLGEVRPFYSEYCVRCHKEGKAKGGFRIDELLARANIEGGEDSWLNVLEKLSGREMPPSDEEKRPAHAEFERQIAWMQAQLERSEQRSAEARPLAQRRLNRAEYNRTVTDLFGLPLRQADAFPPDDTLRGFNTVAAGLNTSPVLIDGYLAAAQDIASAALEDAGPKPPEPKALAVDTNQKDPPNFRLFDGNSFFYWGGAKDSEWERREWIGHAWGVDWRPPHTGQYVITLRGTPKHFAPGERGIFRLEIGGRVVGVYDSPAKPAEDGELFKAKVWIDRSINPESSVVFTFVNGNPHGSAVGETEDYHPNSYEAYRALKEKHFPAHFEKSSDTWMPDEPPGLSVRSIAGARCEISGPHYDAWPPVGFQREHAAALKAENLRPILEQFLPKAYRRPVSDAEIERLVRFAESSQPAGSTFKARLQAVLARALVSPEFIFLLEPAPSGSPRGGYHLGPWELAARLSYFLTGTAPDSELRAAAAQGTLATSEGLEAQATRLLGDPRTVTALTDGFCASWLHLDKLASAMPEPKLFPRFGEDLKRSLAEEPKAFFAAVVRDNLPITDLLDCRYGWINERLAMHYGLDRASARGAVLRRVDLPDGRRGGVLGMGAILTLTSEATRTSPVKRGIFVLESLFNRPPPPPPPNVGDLIPNTAAARSIREHLALHRESPACAGCHNRIDPWGLALENFDAVGAWRADEAAWEDPSRPAARKEGEPPATFAIKADFDLPTKSPAAARLTGAAAARAELLERRHEFARGFTEKLMIYGLGRTLTVSDRSHVERIVGAAEKDGYHLRALLRAIVVDPVFQTR